MEQSALAKAEDDIRECGAGLVSISPMTVAKNREFVEDNRITHPVLSDPGNVVAEEFGLRFEFSDDLIEVYKGFGADLPEYNGDDSWSLPLASRFIIDGDGKIAHRDFGIDYTVRPDPSETVDALKKLG